jgi:hypothetical protein
MLADLEGPDPGDDADEPYGKSARIIEVEGGGRRAAARESESESDRTRARARAREA